MTKRFVITLLLATLLLPCQAQKYKMRFDIPDATADTLYIGYHYREQALIVDSAIRQDKTVGSTRYGVYTFMGNKPWETGMYTLFERGAKKTMMDFTIDGSQQFTIVTTPTYGVANPEKDIKGSEANKVMFQYNNRIAEARKQAREIDERKKSTDPGVRKKAEKEMDELSAQMIEWEENYIKKNKNYRFFQLLDMFRGPIVPDEVEDKPYYYRNHYWDDVDLSDHSLLYTWELFNKMNYFFFGVLFDADCDTICKYADRLFHSIESDTVMLRYFLDYIMPRYYRSTKKIGWDAVWCHLVREFYLSGICTWASAADIQNKRQTVEFLEQSLIGAKGQELYMADTNQSPDPKDWISSHRFPQRYVILWFWDPDCHHCQEQTETLKELYDSLSAAGNKFFEVYAVGYEADVVKWKKYVREHNLPFVNVGGQNVNIDYQVAYNVHGAPTMIILNEERRIIMNKVLPTKAILPFFKKYEEQQRAKRNIK